MSMKIAIMGAGALGGTFGFLLADAGFDVTLVDVDYGQDRRSSRSEGLTLIMPDGTQQDAAPSRRPPIRTRSASVDLVQISVKGYHTTSAAELAAPMVGPDTYVLSVQNGLKNLHASPRSVGREQGHRRRDGPQRHAAEPHPHQVQRRRGRHLHRSVRRQDDPRLPELVELFNAVRVRDPPDQGRRAHPASGGSCWPTSSCNAVAALTGFTGRQLVEFEPDQRAHPRAGRGDGRGGRAPRASSSPSSSIAGDFAIRALSGVGDNKISDAAGRRGRSTHRDRHAQPGRGGAGRGLRRRHAAQLGDRHT